MSLFSKLFGGTFETNLSEGDALFEQGHFGEAKLAFERALSRAKGTDPRDVQAVREKVSACRAALAQNLLSRADADAQEGDMENAFALLDEAGEILPDDPELLEAIKQRKMQYEANEARHLTDDADEISEEELLAIIGGTWTEEQATEFASLPDEFRQGLLAGHDGEHQQATELFSAIAARLDLPVRPKYLWAEIGKERYMAENWSEAVEAFDTFVTETKDDPAAQELVGGAMQFCAQALVRLERFDSAQTKLVEATQLTPENHVMFLNLGVFLRSRGEHAAAIRVFEQAMELMGQMNPDFRVIRELGFAHLEMGHKEEARQSLSAVIEHLASKGQHDQFDPVAATALAKLYEEKGEYRLASDLYRHLATGYDIKNHLQYNIEAARLLHLAGEDGALIDRYLARADELSTTADHRQRIDQIRSQSGS